VHRDWDLARHQTRDVRSSFGAARLHRACEALGISCGRRRRDRDPRIARVDRLAASRAESASPGDQQCVLLTSLLVRRAVSACRCVLPAFSLARTVIGLNHDDRPRGEKSLTEGQVTFPQQKATTMPSSEYRKLILHNCIHMRLFGSGSYSLRLRSTLSMRLLWQRVQAETSGRRCAGSSAT
jgi:hypothetical protein